jgi:molybdopterin-guanine dinucleotide biosynthesis protein A
MIAGIFVGGQSTRMGGLPKGRLLARDSAEPLIVRTSRLLTSLALTPVLVGGAEPYRDLLPELPRLVDLPTDVGPLGGLGALLAVAQGEQVIALACDMPFLSTSLLEQLVLSEATGDALAPKGAAGFWEPFCARYRVATVAPVLSETLAAGERSFRALFARLSITELEITADQRRTLRDWDNEEDMQDDA